MFCNKCGKNVPENVIFCPNCGNELRVNTSYQQNMVMPNNQKVKNNKILFIPLLGIVLILAGIVFSLSSSNYSKKAGNSKSRTVLLYLCGSNLESEIALATTELEALTHNNIDTSNMNVVIYTGGSTVWNNDYVLNTENAIYVLNNNSLDKVYNESSKSMGDSNTFLEFLNYAYDNYPADKYDLIMWDHGLGALGVSSDEKFSNDFLYLKELEDALKSSNFGGNNKFETVVFRSCLNATLEVASIFVPYANYLVASEEVTLGSTGYDTMSFLKEVDSSTNGLNFGKKFISYYEKSLQNLAGDNGYTLNDIAAVATYSVIDLSKVTALKSSLNMFVKGLDLDLNYNAISNVRSNMYQYAKDTDASYDTIDLYTLVDKLSSFSPSTATTLKQNLNSTILYNWSNNNFSTGLSIYFPYNSESIMRSLHFKVYQNLDGFSDYFNFIKKIDSLQSQKGTGGFSSVARSDIDVNINNKKAILKINDENKDNYTKASYTILTRNNDQTFTPLYSSKTFSIEESESTIDLDYVLVRVTNTENNNSSPLYIYGDSNNNKLFYTDIIINDGNNERDARIYLKKDNGINYVKLMNRGRDVVDGIILDINDYSEITFINNDYNILNGNNINDDWEKNGKINNFNVSKYSFEEMNQSNNLYVMFKIFDVDNNYTYSNPIRIN